MYSLERLATRNHTSVSDVLARELRDLVSEHAECLSREVPSFAEALAWPEASFVPPPPRRRSSGAPNEPLLAAQTIIDGRQRFNL